MAYQKVNWVNNQTKLNAYNMNRIEEGIGEAKSAAASIDEKIAGLSKDIVNLSTQLAEKQNELISGTSIKTINDEPILGEGNIVIKAATDVNYQKKNDISLDDLTETGIYKLKNITGNPENTTNSGILHVTKLSENEFEQQWFSETNMAIRIASITQEALKFYVNDIETVAEDGIIHLNAGETYKLRGTLLGKIEIGTPEDTLAGTKIILDGVTIKSTDTSAISYLPASKKLFVELLGDSKNYLMVEDSITTADLSEFGALHSENNMTISGTGYLALINDKGHGVKASELVLNGIPHLYCDTAHDAIHGGSLLNITEGVYYIAHAKDAVSSSEGSADDGIMRISGGKFIINTCAESAFEGKSSLGSKKIYGDTNIILNGPFGDTVFKGVTVYDNVTITNNCSAVLPEAKAVLSDYGDPVVMDANGDPVEAVDNIYTLTESETSYTISGNFSGYHLFVIGNKVDISAFGIYYADETNYIDPFIAYANESKRVKIKFEEGTVSYISKKVGVCINSTKNLQIVGKGDIFIRNENGYGIYASDGDTILAGDGARYIKNSKYGILTSKLMLGEDDGDRDKYVAGKEAPSTSSDAIYILNNTDYDVYVLTRLNSKGQVQAGEITANQYHTGVSILGKVVYKLSDEANILEQIDQVATLSANSGLVRVEQGSDVGGYQNCPLIYVKETSTDLIKTNIVDYTLPLEYDSNVETNISGYTEILDSSWMVYNK